MEVLREREAGDVGRFKGYLADLRRQCLLEPDTCALLNDEIEHYVAKLAHASVTLRRLSNHAADLSRRAAWADASSSDTHMVSLASAKSSRRRGPRRGPMPSLAVGRASTGNEASLFA